MTVVANILNEPIFVIFYFQSHSILCVFSGVISALNVDSEAIATQSREIQHFFLCFKRRKWIFYHRYHNYVITTRRGIDEHVAHMHFPSFDVDFFEFLNLFIIQGYELLNCYYSHCKIRSTRKVSDMKRKKLLRRLHSDAHKPDINSS